MVGRHSVDRAHGVLTSLAPVLSVERVAVWLSHQVRTVKRPVGRLECPQLRLGRGLEVTRRLTVGVPRLPQRLFPSLS
jgi:hypothetical protein